MYTVKIKTLTPIWTGDVDRECKKIKETGIIGSLRWWYEAIVRGYGGYACDPTNSDCNEKDHCDACELFGCTGWSRKFRLESNLIANIPEISIRTREKHKTRGSRRYLQRKVGGLCTNDSIMKLNIIPIRVLNIVELFLLNKSFEIIEEYGGLGAKISQGNGTIKIIKSDIPKVDLGNTFEERKNKLSKYLKKNLKCSYIGTPNLKEFFFWKIKLEFNKNIKDLINESAFWSIKSDEKNSWLYLWNYYNFLPISHHVRDTIRYSISNGNRRHEIFGEQKKGSKIFVSHGYKSDNKTIEFRIFGYEIYNNELKSIEDKLKKDLKSKMFDITENVTIKKIIDLKGGNLL